jgi:N-acyl-D-aspartate/D-glutamate deacylase
LPRSPGGRIYTDVTGLLGKSRAAVVSGIVAQRGLAAAHWTRLRASRLYATLGGNSAAEPTIAAPQSPASSHILHAGGRVVAGSAGSPLPPGLSLHAELMSLQSDGLQPHETIRSATLDAAEALGLGSELGSIAEGRIADLVVVAGDPLGDVADLLDPIAIVQGGRFLSVASLLDAP